MKRAIIILILFIGFTSFLFSQETCSNAIEITFEEYSTCGQIAIINTDLTDAVPSTDLPMPECGNFDASTNDLWYYITVPDGVTELAFHIMNAPTPMPTDEYHHQPGLAIYSGECGSLSLLDCFFEEGDIINNGEIRFETITGLTSGEVLFLRVWDMNNFAVPFFIAASVRIEIPEHSCETPALLNGGGCNILAPKGTIQAPNDCGWNTCNNTVYYYITITEDDFQPVHFQASYVLCMDNNGEFPYPQNTELQLAIYSWNGTDCTGIGGSPYSSPPNNSTYQTCVNGTGTILFYEYLEPCDYIITIDGYQDISGTSLCTFNLDYNVITALNCPNDTILCSNSEPFTLDPPPPFATSVLAPGYSDGVIDPIGLDYGEYTITYLYGLISCSFEMNIINPDEIINNSAICLVTVNEDNKNEILWEKQITESINYYNIYKENEITTEYEVIASISYDSISSFVDINSNPQIESNRYKISHIGFCFPETELSNFHQTVLLEMTEQTDSWYLSWTPYVGIDDFSVNVLRGTAPDNLEIIASFDNTVTEYTDNDPPDGYVYYQIEVVLSTPCDISKSTSYLYSNIATNDPDFYISVGISENNITNNIYPNPTTSSFTIKSENFPANVQIIDLNGKLIKTIDDYSGENIDVTDLQKGVYFVKLTNGDIISVGKLIVE